MTIVAACSMWLANAEKPDDSQATLYMVLFGCLALGGAMLLVCIPLILARLQRRKLPENFMAIGAFWAACAAALVTWTFLQQTQWLREQARQLDTGYYDASAFPPRPGVHPLLFAVLLLAYGVLAVVAFSGGKGHDQPQAGEE